MSNPIRKKNTGEPGNPGQFGSGPRAASGLALQAGPGAEPLVAPTPGMSAHAKAIVQGLADGGLHGRVTGYEKRESITRLYISSGDYRMAISTEDITNYLSVAVSTASNRSRFISDGHYSEPLSPELVADRAKATLLQREMVNRAALRATPGAYMSALRGPKPASPTGAHVGVVDHSHEPFVSARIDDDGTGLEITSSGEPVSDEAKQDRIAGRLARAMGFSQDASTREDLKAGLQDARHRAEQSEAYRSFFPDTPAS